VVQVVPHSEKETNQFWSSCIALASYVLEVMDFRELVLWCADKFDTERRIIQVQGKKTISLAPSIFIRIL
jgi:hypothetical protein